MEFTTLARARQNCKQKKKKKKLRSEAIFKRKIICRWYEYQGNPDQNIFVSFRMIFITELSKNKSMKLWNASVKKCNEMYEVK